RIKQVLANSHNKAERLEKLRELRPFTVSRVVESLSQKKFLFLFFRNCAYLPAIPTQHEGRTRRHEREAGCGGRGWCRTTSGILSRTAKPCGPGAPMQVPSAWKNFHARR